MLPLPIAIALVLVESATTAQPGACRLPLPGEPMSASAVGLVASTHAGPPFTTLAVADTPIVPALANSTPDRKRWAGWVMVTATERRFAATVAVTVVPLP